MFYNPHDIIYNYGFCKTGERSRKGGSIIMRRYKKKTRTVYVSRNWKGQRRKRFESMMNSNSGKTSYEFTLHTRPFTCV